jgi:hypothetical protein
MSEADPLKVQYDMKKFRKALRKTWQNMQAQYRAGGFLFRGADGRLQFRHIESPQIEDFEIKAERRRGEDRL